MSIEAIGSTVQPVMIKGDGLQNLKSQDASVVYKHGAAPADLPLQSVKAVSHAEEEEKLKDAADKANEFVSSFNQELQFSVDKDTDKMIVKVVDKQTGDVIRQIPSKEMLEIVKALDTIHGLIIRKKI
jgi:flagellar protein FlaG